MNRFGLSHKAIIALALDGKWHGRFDFEEAAFGAHRDSGAVKPNVRQWRGGVTKSLQWLVNNGWLLVRRSQNVESFKIDGAKKKYYHNVMKAVERDMALGLIDPKTRIYYHGPHRKEQREKLRVLGSRKAIKPWYESYKKSAERSVGANLEGNGP